MDDFWPTARWGDSKLVAYYLGEDEADVRLVESDGLDFEELISRLERGEWTLSLGNHTEGWGWELVPQHRCSCTHFLEAPRREQFLGRSSGVQQRFRIHRAWSPRLWRN